MTRFTPSFGGSGDQHQKEVVRPIPFWQASLVEQVRRIEALEDGWDGAGSKCISPEVLYRATQTIWRALIEFDDPEPPYLVPAGDGSIQVEWHRKHGELEMHFPADGSTSIWGVDRISGGEFEGENEKAFSLFYAWAPRMASQLNDATNVPVSTADQFFAIAA